MRNALKKIVQRIVLLMPAKMLRFLMPVISKVVDPSVIENIVLSSFVDRLMNSFEKTMQKIVKRGRLIHIKEMMWGGSYFNIAVLNNLLGLVIYALYLGGIPIIEFNEEKEECFSWEWYFEQPFEAFIKSMPIKAEQQLDKTNVHFMTEWIYEQSGRDYERWSFIYKSFVRLNEKTRNYINSEKDDLGDFDSVLGVLIRGTDYIALKPSGHPVQPSVEEVVELAAKVFRNNQYKKVYVATESKEAFNQVTTRFGTQIVLSNKRCYYDELYSYGDPIGKVHFDREKDNYLKGIEYLSSLFLLSECNGLIAGNCGGTKFALLIKGQLYEYCHVFNKGYYE